MALLKLINRWIKPYLNLYSAMKLVTGGGSLITNGQGNFSLTLHVLAVFDIVDHPVKLHYLENGVGVAGMASH